MKLTKIALHLKKQCIQRAANKRYEMLMRAYFSRRRMRSDDETDRIEKEIESLIFFLENADFPVLRHTYPQLSGMEDVFVELLINEAEKDFTILIGEKRIAPCWKNKAPFN